MSALTNDQTEGAEKMIMAFFEANAGTCLTRNELEAALSVFPKQTLLAVGGGLGVYLKTKDNRFELAAKISLRANTKDDVPISPISFDNSRGQNLNNNQIVKMEQGNEDEHFVKMEQSASSTSLSGPSRSDLNNPPETRNVTVNILMPGAGECGGKSSEDSKTINIGEKTNKFSLNFLLGRK